MSGLNLFSLINKLNYAKLTVHADNYPAVREHLDLITRFFNIGFLREICKHYVVGVN